MINVNKIIMVKIKENKTISSLFENIVYVLFISQQILCIAAIHKQ